MADDGQLIATLAVGRGRDQLGQRRQRAQPLPAPQRLDRGDDAVAQPRGALEVMPLREHADLVHRRAQRAVVRAVDQRRDPRDGAGVLGGGHAARGRAWRHLRLGARRPVQRRAPQPVGAGAQAGEPGQQGGGVGGVGAGPKRADGPPVSRRPHHRQAGECLVGQRHPPPSVRKPGPP
ncbi:hypothetical protein, partial [Mycobacterium sp. 1245852.3]|uniref:hypothetical protein n=1 Tax=Mycobacterium sp. 1245852.3 TaxID=1856860 RepID=UPI00351946B5